MRYLLSLVIFTSVICVSAVQAAPVATDIVVRAKARDAKFIGSSIGGAFIRIKDADSGEVLAEGLTEGSTGNTDVIMKAPKERYDTIAEDAAAFKATLMLEKPMFLTIEVLAPYLQKQARTLSQTQTWLVPGKHITGDGLIIEVPGMIVDIVNPGTHRYAPLKQAPFEVKANVVMMCGCTLTSGGLWDGDNIEVAAIVNRDGKHYQTIPLQMQETMNTFSGVLQPETPGNYQITVYSYDAKTGNTGVDKTSFVVTN